MGKKNIKISVVKLLLIATLLVISSCSKFPPRENPVGREHRLFFDTERVSWTSDDHRPLATTIWYPATLNSVESDWTVGVFQAGWNALNADLGLSQNKLPLVVLSHGTGGAALQLSWLAETLAANGFLVMAINHHGNTAAEATYLPEGFMLWWERAQDISSALDQLLTDPKFGSRVDETRIGAAGFSLGGYTVLSLAGAITDLTQRNEFCAKSPTTSICTLPPEAHLTNEKLESIIENNTKVKLSLARSGESYLDKRIKAIYSIAPVHGPALTKDSLTKITIPVRVVVGSKDEQATPEFNAELITSSIEGSSLELLPNVTHYTFLTPCTFKGQLFVAELCSDPEGIDRIEIHQKVATDALEFFNKKLVKDTSAEQSL